MRGGRALLVAALALIANLPGAAFAKPPIVVIDTDIGDDIDDAYALSWALASPRLDVRAITTTFGDTALRARLVRRMLATLGRRDVAVGMGTATAPATAFTQADWAQAAPAAATPDGIALTLKLIRAHPGQVTLIALAPLTTVGAMLARDPATFRKLRGVLLMGGAIRRGYDAPDGTPESVKDAEYNAARDPGALSALLASGVPVTLFPLDSTQIRPDAATLGRLLGAGTLTATVLTALTAAWRARNPWHQTVPTLFDALPVAAAIDPALCPATPLRLAVDDKGYLTETAGPPNARVCLASDGAAVIARMAADLSPPSRAR